MEVYIAPKYQDNRLSFVRDIKWEICLFLGKYEEMGTIFGEDFKVY